MLYKYDKKSKTVAPYRKTSLASHNILERQDLEKWIEENPSILGEELLILTTEYDKFDKTNERLDLLAIDKNGTLAVIELKREDSGKRAELQALKYAAFCSNLRIKDIIPIYQHYLKRGGEQVDYESAKSRIADFVDNEEFAEFGDRPRIFLVANEFRQEVTASVMWLRKFDIDITCVKITPYEIDDNVIAFESKILIPLPEAKNYIIQAEKKERAEHEISTNQKEYLNFFEELIKRARNSIQLSFRRPSPRNYYQIPTGLSGVHYEWVFHGKPRTSFGVELHFETGNGQFNKPSLDKIERVKAELEKQTNEKVVFQRDWGRKWARMFIERNDPTMTSELTDWAVAKMTAIYKVLQPEIEKLR